MESNEFTTEELYGVSDVPAGFRGVYNGTYIIARSNAGRNGDGDLSLVGNQLRYGPLTIAVTVLVDLKPARGGRSTSGTGNFGHVDQNRPIVRGINNHIGVEVDIQGMSPLKGDLRSSCDRCDKWRNLHQRIGTTIASQISRSDISDWL